MKLKDESDRVIDHCVPGREIISSDQLVSFTSSSVTLVGLCLLPLLYHPLITIVSGGRSTVGLLNME